MVKLDKDISQAKTVPVRLTGCLRWCKMMPGTMVPGEDVKLSKMSHERTLLTAWRWRTLQMFSRAMLAEQSHIKLVLLSGDSRYGSESLTVL